MYCSNCGKEIIDNSKFCSNCGYEIIPPQKKMKIIHEKKSPFGFGFIFCIIIPIILFIINFILGKIITGLDYLYIKTVIKTIISFVIKLSFLSGLVIASNEIKVKKNLFSLISIVISCLYIAYCIITSSLYLVKSLNNDKKDSFDIIYSLSNLSSTLFLIIGLIVILLFIFRKNQILSIAAIILFGIAGTSSLIYSTASLIHISKLLNEIGSLTSSISKSYSDTSKRTGTWNVWLRYDDPDQRYSQYDNLYSKRSRFCDKEYAIQNAKEWLLVEHPRARNIYVDDCIFEGYSTSPID